MKIFLNGFETGLEIIHPLFILSLQLFSHKSKTVLKRKVYVSL